MILLQSPSRFLLQILNDRLLSQDKGVDIDCQTVEFDDVRYHIQVSMRNPKVLVLSVALPLPPQEAVSFDGLPFGAIEAIKAAYGPVVQILDPPKDGFDLTLKINLAKLPSEEEQKNSVLVHIASIREVVLGAPLKVFLKNLSMKTVGPEAGQPVALVHRPNESFFVIPQADRVTVIYPMRFQDSIDIVLATSFLQEFVEARRTAALNNAPTCMWSQSPPPELKGAPGSALAANAGFVTFVVNPRHVEGKKLDRTVWNLLTFHAYVSYHVKGGQKNGGIKTIHSGFLSCSWSEAIVLCNAWIAPCYGSASLFSKLKHFIRAAQHDLLQCSEGFMHTRMRRRVDTLIQTLDRAKSDAEKLQKLVTGPSFKKLSIKDERERR